VLTAEPHVMLRCKRVFGKADRGVYGFVRVSDTVENARDLEWFCTRYPIEVEEPERLRARANEHREQENFVKGFLERTREIPPFELAVPARDYQRFAAAFALGTGGLLLADDIGIGKTVSAICTFTDPSTLPALVVTMTHLPRQWEREINRFAPRLRTHVLKTGHPYDLTSLGRRKSRQLALQGAFPDVVITNYHKLSGWAETLAPVVRSVVFDECQELRTGAKTAKYRAAQHVSEKARLRLGCSASPVYNYGGEFFNVVNVLKPGALGNADEFLREWGHIIGRGHVLIDDPKSFGTYARSSGLMLRRTRSEVARELPALQKVPQVVDADEAELEKVEKSCSELARIILSQAKQRRGAQWRASEEFSNTIRQATGIAKAPFVAAFVQMIVECGERVLLYGWHREVYEIWKKKLREYRPVLFTGSESPTQKQASLDAFMGGPSRILMMSLRAGQGVDGLQHHCRTVVHGELDWSPQVHRQCDGRVHRDGQPDPVIAYYCISETGADPVIADKLGVKLGQSEGICNPDAPSVEFVGVEREHAKLLAVDYLTRLGIPLPEPEPEPAPAAEAGASP
jgi:SNF2 family DNA or RNA helicase